MKLPPELALTESCPPLKPPRETSNDVDATRVMTSASRGMSPPPNDRPFNVTRFWSGESPSTEKPGRPPDASGTSVTPGTDAAIEARLP